ncbi:MFS transporter [Methylobacterium sp. EM32]|uniref:MFS transporter n=1 Tax=Methylobacterium sp. EM32 TaxID=3163481 RepID=UPI0033A20745
MTVVPASALEATTMRKVAWRIIPFLMVSYIISYIDRVNAGFAALEMNHDLGLTSAQFGLGAGIFFVSYVLFEVPSNLAMVKLGSPRLWLARIMITWGMVAIGMAFIVGPYSFYSVRFLLGAAEAGFFPGVILYLTYWFPSAYRARMVALFSVSIPLSGLIGSPLSGALLQLDGSLGLRGWQWLFIVEAIPAVILGLIALVFLSDRPEKARWLAPAERDWLNEQLALEASRTPRSEHPRLRDALFNKTVLILALAYCGTAGTSQGLSVWTPQMIKTFGLTNFQVGLVNGIPFAIASIAMVVWARRSDRTRERVWHTALPVGLSAAALGCASLAGGSVGVFLVILSLALVGTYSMKGPFWGLATERLSARDAAAGIAMINALGSAVPLFGNVLIGTIKDATGSFALAVLPLVALSAVGAVTVVLSARTESAGAPEGAHTGA